MAGFLSRLFGGKKKEETNLEPVAELVGKTLDGVIAKSGLDLSFEITDSEEGLLVEMSGGDADELKDKEGQLIDAFQFFIKRVVQHQLPETKVEVVFDSNGFREESNQALIELAERLKKIVLDKNKSVYFRALPPKDRKIVHQYLANDERVKSKSIGEGLYKKIKIFPAAGEPRRAGGRGPGGRPQRGGGRPPRGPRNSNGSGNGNQAEKAPPQEQE
jgi:spoIIIJ-associated protein